MAKNKQTFLEVKRVAEPFNPFGISNGNKNALTIGDNQAKAKEKEVETACKDMEDIDFFQIWQIVMLTFTGRHFSENSI